MKRTILFITLALVAIFSHGQLSDWQNYNSVNWVRKIVADGENGLWIATDGGIVRYDKQTGRSQILNTATAGLPDNNVLTLYVDGEDLWFGTKLHGFGRMRDGKMVAHYTEKNSGLMSDQYCTMIKRNGNRLILGGLLGIYIYDGSIFRYYTTPKGMISPMLNFNDIAEDSHGRLWVGGYDGRGTEALCYMNEYLELVPVPVANEINGMFFDENDVLWMATGKTGLVRYDGNETVRYTTDNSGIASNKCHSFARDNDGKVWLGTDKGVVSFDGENFGLIEISLPTGDYITSILIDGDRKWLGTRKSGMILLEGEKQTECPLSELPIRSNLMAKAAVCDRDGNVFIGAADCLLKNSPDGWERLFEGPMPSIIPCRIADAIIRDNGNIVVAFNKSDTLIAEFNATDTTYITMQNRNPNFVVNRLAIAPDQSLWMATNGGLYHRTGATWERFTPQNSGLTNSEIISLHIDRDGTVWCGAFKAGLFRYDGEYWTQFTHSDNPYSLPTNNIVDIERDAQGRLWVAANDDTQPVIGLGTDMGRGIAYEENGRWINLNPGNSPLPSNTVLDIEFAPNGDMWLGTFGNVGLCLRDHLSEWHTFNTENSGIGNNDVQRIAFDTKHGRLWLVHDSYTAAGLSSASYPEAVTAITPVFVNQTNGGGIFNLQGQRLSTEPEKGLYIINGKKMIKK